MDVDEFNARGKEMVEYICDYMRTVGERKRVMPDVERDYLHELLPEEAPQDPEPWEDIMRDVEEKIMPGVTHWQHPRFHAYFPSGNSFPSILGDMLSSGIGAIGFSWNSNPACTELERVVLDWFGRAMGLPSHFLTFAPESKGGGVMQGSASDCLLVCMTAARNRAIKYLKKINNEPECEDCNLLPKLIAYTSFEAHSCVQKAAKILLLQIRIVGVDENGSFDTEELKRAMSEDIKRGLLPFFVSATIGTTGAGCCDDIEAIGLTLRKVFPDWLPWLHVDAAYAGSAMICPEFADLRKGLEYADSFDTNPNKWLLVNFDCSCLWVKDKKTFTSAFIVDPQYLRSPDSDVSVDFRHWGTPLSRRFRSLKLWFVMRSYGISGLQKYIRSHVKLAKHFESLVKQDSRFEIVNQVRFGLVVFRLVAPKKIAETLNKTFMTSLNQSGCLHLTPTRYLDRFVHRFCVTQENATEKDVEVAWEIIQQFASELMGTTERPKPLEEIKTKKLTRSISKKFSFTRSVSREMYERCLCTPKLHDGATPILSPDSEEDEEDGRSREASENNEQILDFLNGVSHNCKDESSSIVSDGYVTCIQKG